MIPPVNSGPAGDVRTVVQAANEVKRDPQAQTPPVAKSGELSHDQVTLRSAGQPDTEGEKP